MKGEKEGSRALAEVKSPAAAWIGNVDL
jgi:hypothetical protein